MSQQMGLSVMDPSKEAHSTKRTWCSVQKTHCAPLKTHLELPAEVIAHHAMTTAGLVWKALGLLAGCFQVNSPRGRCLTSFFS